MAQGTSGDRRLTADPPTPKKGRNATTGDNTGKTNSAAGAGRPGNVHNARGGKRRQR